MTTAPLRGAEEHLTIQPPVRGPVKQQANVQKKMKIGPALDAAAPA
jgi:hypothetical protein